MCWIKRRDKKEDRTRWARSEYTSALVSPLAAETARPFPTLVFQKYYSPKTRALSLSLPSLHFLFVLHSLFLYLFLSVFTIRSLLITLALSLSFSVCYPYSLDRYNSNITSFSLCLPSQSVWERIVYILTEKCRL